jgi:CheY-like chemotaxis protein
LKEQFNPNQEPRGRVCIGSAHLLDTSVAKRLAHCYVMKTIVIGKMDGSLVEMSNDDETIIEQYSSITEMIPHVFFAEVVQFGQISLETSRSKTLSSLNVSNGNMMTRTTTTTTTEAALEKKDESTASSVGPATTSTWCDLSKLRVLYAEENSVYQKILARTLQRLGGETAVMVENGKLAVEVEAQQEFDIVLMDMQMPVMDGCWRW